MCYGFSVSAEKKKQFRTRTKQLIGCSKKLIGMFQKVHIQLC